MWIFFYSHLFSHLLTHNGTWSGIISTASSDNQINCSVRLFTQWFIEEALIIEKSRYNLKQMILLWHIHSLLLLFSLCLFVVVVVVVWRRWNVSESRRKWSLTLRFYKIDLLGPKISLTFFFATNLKNRTSKKFNEWRVCCGPLFANHSYVPMIKSFVPLNQAPPPPPHLPETNRDDTDQRKNVWGSNRIYFNCYA